MKNPLSVPELIAEYKKNERIIRSMDYGKLHENRSTIEKYITAKHLFTEICDCLDFINFGIMVFWNNNRLISIKSIFDIGSCVRFINILTGGMDEFFINTVYTERYQTDIPFFDRTDHRELLEHKLKNLKSSASIMRQYQLISEMKITTETINKAIAEIHLLMDKFGIDKDDIAESTYKVSIACLKKGKTHIFELNP